MMSDRPYRKPLSSEACREEIAVKSGIMYDPGIVETVLRSWDDIVTPYCE